MKCNVKYCCRSASKVPVGPEGTSASVRYGTTSSTGTLRPIPIDSTGLKMSHTCAQGMMGKLRSYPGASHWAQPGNSSAYHSPKKNPCHYTRKVDCDACRRYVKHKSSVVIVNAPAPTAGGSVATTYRCRVTATDCGTNRCHHDSQVRAWPDRKSVV